LVTPFYVEGQKTDAQIERKAAVGPYRDIFSRPKTENRLKPYNAAYNKTGTKFLIRGNNPVQAIVIIVVRA
jgi:hypothetical protein